MPEEPDLRPLTAPIDVEDYRDWRNHGDFLDDGIGPRRILTAAGTVFIGIVFVFVIASQMGANSGWFVLGVAVVVGGGGLLVARRWLRRRYRLEIMADANGFLHDRGEPATPPGILFSRGEDGRTTDRFHSREGRETEFGGYRYTTGDRDDRTVHRWSYFAVRLDHPLPHLVLDARAGDVRGSNLPAGLASSQRLSLEGDFDRWFHLYAPKGYERDALEFFTPDLMAAFIDEAPGWDAEIVDDWLVLVHEGASDWMDPERWRAVFRLRARLAEHAVRRGARYRDERVPGQGPSAAAVPTGAPGALPAQRRIAEEGRRLRPRTSWLHRAFIVAGVIVVFWFVLVR